MDLGDEEPRVRAERIQAVGPGQRRQGLREECLHPPSRARVPAPEPGVADHLRLREDGEERMVGWPPVLAGVVAFQRALLVAVPLEDRGVQIQHGAQRHGPELRLPCGRQRRVIGITRSGGLEVGLTHRRTRRNVHNFFLAIRSPRCELAIILHSRGSSGLFHASLLCGLR